MQTPAFSIRLLNSQHLCWLEGPEEPHSRPLHSASARWDVRMIFSGCGDMTIRVWDRQTAQSICLAGQPATVSSIAVRGNLVAAGDAVGGVFFFDLKNRAPPPRASPSCDCLTLPPTQFKPFLVDNRERY